MKRILGLLFVVILAVTLVACNDNEAELTSIKVLGNFDTFDPQKDYVSTLIKEVTGIDVEYEFLPQDSTADAKLYLDIAGRAQYHLLKLSSTQFNQLRGVGALLDIKPLLEKHGKNILSSVDEQIWGTTTFDGKIYAVPQKNPTNNINSALFLRKDIFVKNNIDLPETLTEFKEAMIELKTKEGSNFVPFSASSHNIEPIRGAFGIVTDWVPQTDGSVKYWAETPQFEAYASYIKELVDAGVMQEGYLTVPGYGSSSRPGLQNGTVAVTLDAWWSGNGIINGIASSLGKTEQEIYENGSTYLHFIPSLKGDANYPLSTAGKGQSKMDYSVTYFFAIPAYMSDYAVEVIKFMDKKLEEDNFKKLTIGTEGVHHEVIDGKYYPILTPDAANNIPFDMMNKADYFLTGTDADKYAQYWEARARKNPRQQFVWESMNTEELKTTFGIYDKLGLAPGFQIYGSNVAKLTDLAKIYLELRITGGNSGTHQQLIDKLRTDAKLVEATTEVNAWYQAN
ncbi:extracellular solute-binding protein [Acholeplasma granularum]|uniref:extracellular solute-binding protein n=1 Tax=Acholeplasma granularum TaxID=264635 RepID=UPI000472715E|nr:extracellular solute-binding protein [Acholeplasma granularum]